MKKALIVLTLLAGFSSQSMGPPQDQIPFKTSDDQIVYLDSRVAQQSGTLDDLIKDKEVERGKSLPVGDVTLEEFKKVIPFLQLLATTQDEQTAMQQLGEYYNALQLTDNERTSLHGLIDYLDVGKMFHILPIPVQTNDETIFWVEPGIISQSSVLCLNYKDCANSSDPIFLPDVNNQTFACLLSLMHERHLEIFDCTQWSALSAAVNALDIEFLKKDEFSVAKIGTNAGKVSLADLIIKALAASKKNARVTLSQEEYETYLSLDEQMQRTLEEYFILWHVRALNWIKTHPKTAVGLAAGGLVAAGGLYYWLKNTN